jgi:hypothetical protein
MSPTAVESIMPQFSPIRRCVVVLTLFLALCCARTACAASDGGAFVWPVLYAKNWIIGYSMLFLGILLGMLAVLIPSMRKVLRKKD